MTVLMTGGPVGLEIANQDRKMISTPGCLKGQIQQVDLSVVDSDARTWTTVEDISAANFLNLYCVALEEVAATESGMFRFVGNVDTITTGTPAVGATLEAAATEELSATTVVSKCCAYVLETGVDDELTRVFFDGINGFGFTET